MPLHHIFLFCIGCWFSTILEASKPLNLLLCHSKMSLNNSFTNRQTACCHQNVFLSFCLCRWLEGAAVPSGVQIKGVCVGGCGEGKESHDLCAPAGGSLQHTSRFSSPAEERRSLQSGSRWPPETGSNKTSKVLRREHSLFSVFGLAEIFPSLFWCWKHP